MSYPAKNFTDNKTKVPLSICIGKRNNQSINQSVNQSVSQAIASDWSSQKTCRERKIDLQKQTDKWKSESVNV